MTAAAADALRPCPFCGEANVSIGPAGVRCHGCKAIGPWDIKEDDGGVVSGWNRRALPDGADPVARELADHARELARFVQSLANDAALAWQQHAYGMIGPDDGEKLHEVAELLRIYPPDELMDAILRRVATEPDGADARRARELADEWAYGSRTGERDRDPNEIGNDMAALLRRLAALRGGTDG